MEKKRKVTKHKEKFSIKHYKKDKIIKKTRKKFKQKATF